MKVGKTRFDQIVTTAASAFEGDAQSILAVDSAQAGNAPWNWNSAPAATRCGECVNVCPVKAIKVDHSAGEGSGYPFIDPDTPALHALPPGQPCMPACTAGALQIVPLNKIDIGIANYFDQTLSAIQRPEECTMCVDHVPRQAPVPLSISKTWLGQSPRRSLHRLWRLPE